MLRGEIWTLRDTSFASKARPVVIVQAENFDIFDTIILCLLTSFDSENIKTRVRIDPTVENGLKKSSYVMTDKIVSVNKDLLGQRVGMLEQKYMNKISVQLAKILGIDNKNFT